MAVSINIAGKIKLSEMSAVVCLGTVSFQKINFDDSCAAFSDNYRAYRDKILVNLGLRTSYG